MAMIIALGTTANIFAQKNLKIYFKTAEQDVEDSSTPSFILRGDVPADALGVQITPEGVRWANGYRVFSGWHGKSTDRLIAAYVDENTKMDSKLKLTFENFPFEVNAIQWNIMNDLMSGAIFDFSEWDSDIFDNYTVNYKYTPKTGNAITGSEQHWDLNPLPKRTDFNRADMPGASNMAMNGLTSFEFSEENYFKIGFLWWSIYSRKTALNDNCRTFIKAGYDGKKEPDANDWAFNIKYSLPTLALRFADGRTNNTLIVDENDGKGVSLQAYISDHAGAIEPGKLLTNTNKFYYDYVSLKPDTLDIDRTTGKAYPKKAGAVDVKVYLRYGKGNPLDKNEPTICVYTKRLQINESVINESSPKICIGFVDGKKGYDVTVGDQNAQIQGFITANTPTDYSTGGYQFEYYESSNGEIITIDPTTGKITPKKEGDVNITAVLKKGSRIVSNPYTYTLHVFAQHEGLEFRRINTYRYTTSSNHESWNVTSVNLNSYAWTSNGTRLVNTSINGAGSNYGVNDWKQIASFSTNASERWRAICQEIAFDVYVPKYTKSITQYSFAGNAAIGDKKTHQTDDWYIDLSGLHYKMSDGSCKYGFEINYLNQKWVNGKPVNEQITLEEANTKLQNRSWNTNAGSVTETFARSGASSYTSNVGAANALNREINNVDADDSYKHKSYTVYFAAMAYLWMTEGYPGDVSIGFKGIPTYEYHAKITYAKNDGTNAIVHTQSGWKTSTSKTETFKLFQGASNSEKAQLSSRVGYTFLGWSTDPNATTPEYELEDDFPIYDNVNGGGMGPDTLYAVWKPNNYIVTLHKNDGGEDETAQIEVTYGQPMPLEDAIGNKLAVPTREGYTFLGYSANQNNSNDMYYQLDWQGNIVSYRTWQTPGDGDLYAQWERVYTITFNTEGGIFAQDVSTGYGTILEKSETSLKLLARKNSTECNDISCTNRINIKPGYKLLGWYTEPQREGDAEDSTRPQRGVEVFGVEIGNNFAYHFYAKPETSNPKYWDSDKKWVGTDDLTVYAHYQIIFDVDKDLIAFKEMTPKNGVTGADIGYAIDYAKLHKAETINTIDLRYVDPYDVNNTNGIMEVFEEKKNDPTLVSPNALLYIANTKPDAKYANAVIVTPGQTYCQNMVVTDRYSMKIPYAFNAQHASYARDANVASNDAAKDQAKNSTWGTICLPYPIQNNTNGVKFYELQSTANNYMEFEEMAQDEVIPANTPVLYIRADGGVSSMITIKEQNVGVPMNANYTAVNKSYSNADESIRDWEFRGNLKTTVFYGKDYVNPPAGAQILDGDVYYFKQDKFTYLNPKMEKNGKTYQAAKMTLYPYRAYFYKNTKGSYYSSAKVSEYSILVIGEDGATLDITNEIFGDGEGDGKIYDLNGIRVMKPVKGRLYIVNGQKKVYK